MTDNTLPQDAWLKEAERLIEEFGFACMAADRDEDITQSCAALLAHILTRPASPAVPPDLHARIRNLPCNVPSGYPFGSDLCAGVYQQGHRDACRAAAGLMSAALSASPPAPAAQPAVPVQPDEPPCKRCNGTGVVDDGEIGFDSSGTIAFENGPIKCVADCPVCTRPAPTAAVRLTDAQIDVKWRETEGENVHYRAFARALESALSVRPSNDIADDIPGSTAAGGVDSTEKGDGNERG